MWNLFLSSPHDSFFWEGYDLESALKAWSINLNFKAYKSLQLIFLWGTWTSRNKVIFQDCFIPPVITTTKGLSIINHFPQEANKKKDKRRLIILDVGVILMGLFKVIQPRVGLVEFYLSVILSGSSLQLPCGTIQIIELSLRLLSYL